MIFSLDVRRALKGDCLLLHFGTRSEPGLVLIDGGPAKVYAPHLRPRILEIKKARRLDEDDPLPVDLLMVSHVDDDHIKGILDLTRELMENPAGAPLVRVLSFWHNSFDDIIDKDPAELTASVTAGFGVASLTNGLPDGATVDSNEDEEVIVSTLKVLASIEQGHRLRADADKLDFPLNPEFDGKLILAGKESVEVAEGLTFTVVGPMKPELKKLQDKHDEWLKGRKKKKDAKSSLAAYVDPSVPNLSSIVVIAEVEDKRMLLTGDARGDKILEGLELAGVLKKKGKMHVDLLKVPHHGSANNLEQNFFERVTADHYVFSGNGEHGNPEREAIEMLLKARGTEHFEIHLTYPVKEIDAERQADWKKEQAKEKKKKSAKKKPRENWSAAKHGLAALFTKAKLGDRLHIVDAKKPHVIDLLDRLGY